MKDENWAEANEILEQLLKSQPNSTEWKTHKGHMLAQRDRNIESARSLFARIIRNNPLKCDGYAALLDYAKLQPELDEIKGMLDEASRSKSVNGYILRDFKKLYARYYGITNEYDKAFKIYDELISGDPDDFEAYLWKGNLHTRLLDKEEGDKCFEKYKSLVPKDHPYAQHLDDCMEKAKSFYDYFIMRRRWRNRVKREHKVLSLQAQMYTKLSDGKFVEANEILDQLLQIEPENPEWKVLKGHMHAELYKDIESAKSTCAEIIKTSPLDCLAYKSLLIYANSRSIIEMARIKDMIDKALESAKGTDNLRDFKCLYADYHIKVGEYNEAFAIDDELISEDPEDIDLYSYKGDLHKRLMQKEEAVKCFEKCLSSASELDLVQKDHPYAQHLNDLIAAVKARYAEKIKHLL